ncbi:uncharacterized protein BP5553_02321 [Venustampulla echinocandica]|uniref:RNase III domain-containing protein n=1 Tax=Venustampulla echinocandica TaxID=2656787 RepID=A0A370U3J2_9HELO|nr:uncharacterized protein BP5553_02321 [Venustampulla echinocandica]RDL42342.1 hypothetical protein BP5553_02321 [Venustampulla echinocandica]
MPVDRREVVAAVEAIFGYQFRNSDICWEALNCKGAGGFAQGHTRLALLGDRLLGWRLTNAWYPTGKSTEIGTNIIDQLANNAHLALVGRNIGLEAYINSNPSQKGQISGKMIAGTVEALLAAFYLDGGVEVLDRALARLELLSVSGP